MAVTGSMVANEALACRRLERALAPYLSESTTWLAGSVGTVGTAAVRFLVEQHQKVSVVGYDRFDCAPELRKLVEFGKLRFLDASMEPIPKGMAGPSQRDILSCVKSDLVILLWDGRSSGTSSMVQYFQSQGVATLLVFL